MRRVAVFLSIAVLLASMVISLRQPSAARAAAMECQTFPETGMTLCDPFLSYWRNNGGLAQQGLPLSNVLAERSTVDKQMYPVTYFERAVMEWHGADNGGILLSLLGRDAFLNKYPNGAQGRNDLLSGDECYTFTETGKTVCGTFLTYWRQHGGLAQQGFPLSEQLSERNAVDGKTYVVQYFERAVFEYHPENAGTPYDVLLSLLGSTRLKAQYPTGVPSGYIPPTPAPAPSPTPVPPAPTPKPAPPPPAPAPVTSGQAQGAGFTFTLHEVRNPQAGDTYYRPRAGYKFVAVDISVTNTGSERVGINRLYTTLKTTDNREYERVSAPPEPQLKLGDAQPGQTSRGWVTFEIPTGAQLYTLTYDPTFGRGPAIIYLNR